MPLGAFFPDSLYQARFEVQFRAYDKVVAFNNLCVLKIIWINFSNPLSLCITLYNMDKPQQPPDVKIQFHKTDAWQETKT